MHKVIVFSEYFTPAFLAGGPPKSASNMIKFMNDKINFKIYTKTALEDLNSLIKTTITWHL